MFFKKKKSKAHYECFDNEAIVEHVGLCKMQVTRLVSEYRHTGLDTFIQASPKSQCRNNSGLKKQQRCRRPLQYYPEKEVQLMFRDEAGFGRINKPKYCWWGDGIRSDVPCHHIREYRYAFGAVEPLIGEGFFLVIPYCNTPCMNVFLEELSKQYTDDDIVLVCDGTAWHKSSTMVISEDITIIFIPPYTPEMNPIEQIWRRLRTKGFKNEVFQTLEKIVDRLCETINNLAVETISSITLRGWILNTFS